MHQPAWDVGDWVFNGPSGIGYCFVVRVDRERKDWRDWLSDEFYVMNFSTGTGRLVDAADLRSASRSRPPTDVEQAAFMRYMLTLGGA